MMILIVGMGLTGLTIADRIVKTTDNEVIMIEKEDYYGGLHHDRSEKDMVIHESDNTIFSSNNETTWNYINSICRWDRFRASYSHAFSIEKKITPCSLHYDMVNILCNEYINNDDDLHIFLNAESDNVIENCEDIVLASTGSKLYYQFFLRYLTKIWKINPIRLHKRVGKSFIDRLNSSKNPCKYNGIPNEGYHTYFDKILSHPKIKYLLNTDYTTFSSNNNMSQFNRIIYTGKIDDYFENLTVKYIGYKNTITPQLNYFQQYPYIHSLSDQNNDDIIIDNKYLSTHASNKHTFITRQQIVENCKPFLPVETIQSVKEIGSLIQKSREDNPHIHFIGRLAECKNMTTSEIIENALAFVEEWFNNKSVPDKIYSHSMIEIMNYNISNSITNKRRTQLSLSKDIYKLNQRMVNLPRYLFQLETSREFPIETLDDHIIIISRYSENIDWINQMIDLNKWIRNIIIFNKGEDDLLITRPDIVIEYKMDNIGREGDTYLQYIINNYDDLPEHIWFLQANPFDHSPDFIQLMSEESIKSYNNSYQGLTYKYLNNIPNDTGKDTRFYINNHRIINYFIDKVNQQTVDIHKFHDQEHERKVNEQEMKYDTHEFRCYYDYLCNKIGIEKPAYDIIGFTWSAIFYVSKNTIRNNEHSCYKKLHNVLLEYDLQGGNEGYMLERFWDYLFTKRSYMNIREIYRIYKLTFFPDICGCYCEGRKMLFVMQNNNNENNFTYKTSIHDKTKCMLYPDPYDNNSVIEISDTYFNGKVIDRIFCNSLHDAKNTIISYYTNYKEEMYRDNIV